MLWDDGGNAFKLQTSPILSQLRPCFPENTENMAAHTLLPDGIPDSELSLLGAKASPSPLPCITDFFLLDHFHQHKLL